MQIKIVAGLPILDSSVDAPPQGRVNFTITTLKDTSTTTSTTTPGDGSILSVAGTSTDTHDTDVTHTMATTGGSGTGATVDVVTDETGTLTSVTIAAAGTGYAVGDVLSIIADAGISAFNLDALDANMLDPATITPNTTYSYAKIGKEGKYEITYSDSITPDPYDSTNGVRAGDIIMSGDGSLAYPYVASSDHEYFKNLAYNNTTGTLSGTIDGLINGRAYGFDVKHTDASDAVIEQSVGLEYLDGVIVNSGPEPILPNYRVFMKGVPGNTNTQKAQISIRLNGDTMAQHTTGRYGDIESAKLGIRKSGGGAYTFLSIPVDSEQSNTLVSFTSTAYNVGTDVKGETFEFILRLVDGASGTNAAVGTDKTSATSNKAKNVKGLALAGAHSVGTKIVATWNEPDFFGLPIVGYKGYIQTLAAGDSDNTCDLAQATLAFTTVSADIAAGVSKTTATITGLNKLGKYAVWVRAYHADGILGTIGDDASTAPARTGLGTTASPYVYPEWAGKYTEGSSSTFGTYLTTAGDGIVSLTGAPATPTFAMFNGKEIQADGAPSAADMNKSVSLRWEDKDLDFGGEVDGATLQVIAVNSADISHTELSALIAGTVEKTANTAAIGAPANTVYYQPTWTDLTAVSDLGAGVFQAAGTFPVTGAVNTSLRYLMFNNSNTSPNVPAPSHGAADTTQLSPITNSTIALMEKVTSTSNGVTTVTNYKGTNDTGASTAALELGESYIFALRLKNNIGESTPYIFASPTMVQGAANASELESDATDSDGDLTGADTGVTSTVWNPAEQRFETLVSTPIEATGAKTPITYSALVTSVIGDSAPNTLTVGNAVYTVDATHENAVTATTVGQAAGVTLLHFNAVRARTQNIIQGTNAQGVTTYTAGTNPTHNAYASVSLSDMQGMKFGITLRAKNANSTTATITANDLVLVASDARRQLFAPKADYAALVPTITIASPTAAAVTASTNTSVHDVRESGADYVISLDAKDLTYATEGGRHVDKVKYEVYQMLPNGDKKQVVDSTQPDMTGDGLGESFVLGSGTDGVAGADDIATKFNIRFAKTQAEMGCAFKVKMSYISNAGAEFAQSGMAGGQVFETASVTKTFATIPLATHDEAGYMSIKEANEKLTVHWSKAGPTYPNEGETVTGYKVELYDRATYEYSTTAQNDVNFSTTDALATPVGSQTFGASSTEAVFTGLDNGKNYVPIVYTITDQNGSSVTSAGRTVYGSIGATAFNVQVKNAAGAVLRTVKRFSSNSSAWSSADDETAAVFDTESVNVGTPFGLPIITANVASGSNQKLTIDSNGSVLLYGSMLQVAAAPGRTAAGVGLINNHVAANRDLFYLDLSFGAGGAAAAAASSSSVGGSTRELYKLGDVEYPSRYVTSVGAGYLGSNWSTETNYVFASNAAGTTAGKISAGAAGGISALA